MHKNIYLKLQNSKVWTAIFVGLITLSISCNNSTNENNVVIETQEDFEAQEEALIEETPISENKNLDTSPQEFLEYLENEEDLSHFFNDEWTFVFHNDNRSNGSTDGELKNLKPNQINTTIQLEVYNDDMGWENEEPNNPETYVMDFNLKEYVSEWNRYEISDYRESEEGEIYIEGDGAFGYMIVYYENDKISKLEYREEDPG